MTDWDRAARTAFKRRYGFYDFASLFGNMEQSLLMGKSRLAPLIHLFVFDAYGFRHSSNPSLLSPATEIERGDWYIPVAYVNHGRGLAADWLLIIALIPAASASHLHRISVWYHGKEPGSSSDPLLLLRRAQLPSCIRSLAALLGDGDRARGTVHYGSSHPKQGGWVGGRLGF